MTQLEVSVDDPPGAACHRRKIPDMPVWLGSREIPHTAFAD